MHACILPQIARARLLAWSYGTAQGCRYPQMRLNDSEISSELERLPFKGATVVLTRGRANELEEQAAVFRSICAAKRKSSCSDPIEGKFVSTLVGARHCHGRLCWFNWSPGTAARPSGPHAVSFTYDTNYACPLCCLWFGMFTSLLGIPPAKYGC